MHLQLFVFMLLFMYYQKTKALQTKLQHPRPHTLLFVLLLEKDSSTCSRYFSIMHAASVLTRKTVNMEAVAVCSSVMFWCNSLCILIIKRVGQELSCRNIQIKVFTRLHHLRLRRHSYFCAEEKSHNTSLVPVELVRPFRTNLYLTFL